MLFVAALCQNSYHISKPARKFFAIFLSSLLAMTSTAIGLTITKIHLVEQLTSATSLALAIALVPTPTLAARDSSQHYRGTHCDKVIYSGKGKNGTVQSPMFPGPYSPRTFCRYEFQGQGQERIQLKFSEFSIPSDGTGNQNCEEGDSLQILVPIRGKYEVVETICGDTIPKPVMSNGPKMLVEFRGRYSGKGNRGFKAEYKFVENFGIITGQQLNNQECGFEFNSTKEKTGWFHSPNFPGIYPQNVECNYLFYGRQNERVAIKFSYFDVEGIQPCEESTASDYVEFSNFMTTDRKFRRMCETNKRGWDVKSDGKFFRVTFRSNDRFESTGFRASYQFHSEPPSTTETPAMSVSEQFNGKGSTMCKVLNELLMLTTVLLFCKPISAIL